MVEIIATARQVGGSIMIVIPKEIAKYKAIRPGKRLRLELRDDDDKDELFGAFPGLGPWVKPDPSEYSKYA